MLSFLLMMSSANLLCDERPKRRFTVADDIAVSYFGDPNTGQEAPVVFSPDGQYIVVDTVRGLVDRNRPESSVRIYRTAEVYQFLIHPELKHEPSPMWTIEKSTYKDGPIITKMRWLADSSGVAFLVKTGTGNDQLFLANLGARTVNPLTLADQQVTAFDIRSQDNFVYTILSPTIGEKALAESRATSVVGTGRDFYSLMFPTEQSISKLYDLSELWAVVNGRRFRVENKPSAGPITLYGQGQMTLALSPDGRSVVTAMPVGTIPQEWETLYQPSLPSETVHRVKAGRQDLGAPAGSQYVSEYMLIDLSDGKMKPLTGGPTGYAAGWDASLSVDWSPDGRLIVLSDTFLAPDEQELNGPLNSPCVVVIDLVNNHPACLERIKGRANTRSGYEDGYQYVARVRFGETKDERISVEHYALGGSKGTTTYARSDEGSWVEAATTSGWPAESGTIDLAVKESFTEPPVLVASDKRTKTSRVILDPNPQLKDIELGQASVYQWKDRNGREWTGGLYKPPDFVLGQRYPLVLQTHGFPETLFRPHGAFPTAFAARELAAAGILVLQANDCPILNSVDEAACNVAGYQAAVQQLVTDGLVESDRVGIAGFSRSCYYVMEALTNSSLRLKAASITDGMNEGYLEYMVGVDLFRNISAHTADSNIGAPPFGKGLQLWLKRSPEFNMDKVTTPLQVVASGRIGLLEMWEPYAALRYLNKPVDLIILARGTHTLTNPGERLVSQGSTVDWFRFWLKVEEDPDPAKVDQYTRWRELRKLQEENLKKLASEVKNY